MWLNIFKRLWPSNDISAVMYRCLSKSELLKVIFGLVLIWDNGLWSRFPSCRADHSMFVSVSESLDSSDGLLDVTTHLLVVDGDWSYFSSSIDYEKTSQCSSIESILRILNQDSVVSWYFLGDISYQGNVDLSQSTLLSCSFSPSQMGEMRVNWYGEYFCSDA